MTKLTSAVADLGVKCMRSKKFEISQYYVQFQAKLPILL